MKFCTNIWITQFVKFGLVGMVNTAIGLGSYYLFLWLGCSYLLANIISWIISVFNAFYWNNKYVFASNNRWHVALLRTYLSYGFSLVLGTSFLYLLVEYAGVSDLIAPVCTLFLTIPMNFLLNKFLTFRSR